MLLIATDNLSAWMCGCYGNTEIRTPNIDLLARLGMRFPNAFTLTPARAPGRATLLTGRLATQHGIQDFLTPNPVADPPQGQAAPPPWFSDEIMLSDVLAGAGYECGYVGRWGMGSDSAPDHHFSYHYTTLDEKTTYHNPTVSKNGQRTTDQGYLPDLITGAATEFLDRQSADKPFCLIASYPIGTEPYDNHPSPYSDMYAGARFEGLGWLPKADNALRGAQYMDDPVASLRQFAPAVTAVDAQLKVLHNKLRERRFWSNTLVVFTSVNGHLAGRHGLWGSGLASNPPNMFDEAIQVPLIVSWPGEIPIEAIQPQLINLYDVMPTVCDLCQASAPTDRNMPGRSFSYMLRNDPRPKDQPEWPETVFGIYHDTLMARTNRFKVILRQGGQGPNEFYILSQDPREMRNLYDDPSVVTVRDRLAAQAREWLGRYAK